MQKMTRINKTIPSNIANIIVNVRKIESTP